MIWNTYYTAEPPHAVTPKGSFWWRDVLQFVDIFRGISAYTVQDGKSYLFWEDLWNNKVRDLVYHRIYSFARNSNLSVLMFSTSDLPQLFALPLSEQAFQEYLAMSAADNLEHLNDESDRWTYVWGNGIFSSHKIYAMNFSHVHVPVYTKWIWKSSCTMKVKVFGWLLLINRLNTYDMLDRRHCSPQNASLLCVLCSTGSRETTLHLFFHCPFSTQCWAQFGVVWNLSLSFGEMLVTARNSYNSTHFVEKVLYAAWNIWKQRNSLIFENIVPSVPSWRVLFRNDFSLVVYRVKNSERDTLLQWLNLL